MTVITADPDAALAGLQDGATVLIGGFGPAGQPVELIDALLRTGVGDLTVVNNNAGNGDIGLAALLAAGRVRKIICSFPRQSRLLRLRRALPGRQDRAGAGAAGQPRRADPRRRRRHRRVLHPDRRRHAARRGQGGTHASTAATTCWSTDPRRRRAGQGAHRADTLGNLVYRKTARNFGPIMAAAATTTVAQVA